MFTQRNATLAVTTVMATLVLSGPLNAQQPAPAGPSTTVRYSDLDLSTPYGVRSLYTRIQNAAWAVCREIVPASNAADARENLKCRHTLVESAVAQVNKPALTALLTGHKPADLTASR
jgi:UrcA family protein